VISGYEARPVYKPEAAGKFQWGAAMSAGFLAGAVLLLAPRGSPWSTLTFFSPVVMGRILPPDVQMPLILTWLVHLVISVIYGLIISRVIAHLTQGRAVAIGGLIGLGLYLANFGVVTALWPQVRGSELTVIFTHIVFGLIAAGAYRGLLRRRAVFELPAHSPT
jgi:hypothetical protein